MTRVFVAGSITLRHIDAAVKERIDNIVAQDFDVVVGDAAGVDSAVQAYLVERGAARVTVYCSGDLPRHNLGRWEVCRVLSDSAPGSRAFFTAKDVRMAEAADFGLMIWDGRSTGTLSNVMELLLRGKKSVVFVSRARAFRNVGTIEQLDELLASMNDADRRKAQQKIRPLMDRLDSIRRSPRQALLRG